MECNPFKVLISESVLSSRLKELGQQISNDYENKELILLIVLKGSIIFAADLMRNINVPLNIEFLKASSYEGTTSSGNVQTGEINYSRLLNKHVLLVDDILDTGTTLDCLKDKIELNASALSIKTCVLLNKRTTNPLRSSPDYYAFLIEDKFVIGYGLDYNEQYRNLPYIAELQKTD